MNAEKKGPMVYNAKDEDFESNIFLACSRHSDSGVRAKEESEKKIRRKRSRGREEGTRVRFVFKWSFRPLCRLVIQKCFQVLKVFNQATGDKPHCLLNLTKICLYPSFSFVFCKRIYSFNLQK